MKQQRLAWLTVAGLWLTLAIMFGSVLPTQGLYYRPISAVFHTSREGVAMISSLSAIGMCAGGLLAGALMLWLDARRVIMIGAVLSGLSFFAAGRAPTFSALLYSNLLVGLGGGLGGLVPVSFIVGNWFGRRPGLAMGVAMAGTSLGGSVMVMIVNSLIVHFGWRISYQAMGFAPFVIVLPLMLVLRSAPPAPRADERVATSALPGLELPPALRTREFWIIVATEWGAGAAAGAVVPHLPAYLTGIGYRSGEAALAVSVVLGITSLGKVTLGLLADRRSGRLATVINCLLEGLGGMLLIGAARSGFLLPALVFYGLTWGTPLALLPVLTIETLGLKRYGLIAGLSNLALTIGQASGSLLAGWTFDRTGGYADAYVVMALALLINAVAVAACRPLSALQEQARPASPAAPASAALP